MNPIPTIVLLTAAWTATAQDGAKAEPSHDLDNLSALAGSMASQVAELRGKAFLKDVHIEVADRATFLSYARRRMDELHGEDRMHHDQAVARVSGLVPIEMDLQQVLLEVLAEQVGGFYEPTSGTFFVMEGTDPDLTKIIMAHELAHALDDQYHDLDGVDRRLSANSDALLAHHAVAEGSAQVLMFSWLMKNIANLDRQALADAQANLDTTALRNAPPYVWKPLLALYSQGQAFLERRATPSIVPRSANMADLEQAFTQLPTSTEQILHPVKYWDPERFDEPVTVELKLDALPEGWCASLEDTFGELMLAILTEPLNERHGLQASPLAMVAQRYTSNAAAGWGGDRYVLLEHEGGHMLHLSSVWDRAEDADEFALALSDLSKDLETERKAGLDEGLHGYHLNRVDELRVDWSIWYQVPDATAQQAIATIG
ncbi:MAG: hypothetical protein ACI8QC_000591 [Planctomycetota bacterium]|jgi:hypothetical protein